MERPDGSKAQTQIAVRRIGDEVGFVTRTGLILSITGVREVDGTHSHYLSYSVTAQDTVLLAEAAADFEVLTSMRAGNKIRVGNGPALDVEMWGNLEHLGTDLDNLRIVYHRLGLSTDSYHLIDLTDFGTLISLGILRGLFDGVGIERMAPGFMLGHFDEAETADENWAACSFRMPIVMNLKDHGVVVWCEGRGATCKIEDTIRGFRAERQDNWRYELRQRFERIDSPELWFHEELPGIPVISFGEEQAIEMKAREPLEFAGELFDISDDE